MAHTTGPDQPLIATGRDVPVVQLSARAYVAATVLVDAVTSGDPPR
jgi:hypothetical protein